MKIKIHRGTREIGGSCVELKSKGKSLILDIGSPLVNSDGSHFEEKSLNKPITELLENKLLPPIKGLYENKCCNISGVILSHSHQDHFGLAHYVQSNIPVYVTEGTKELINISQIFLTNVSKIENLIILPDRWKPIKIGPFTVTTYPVDHSAPDAVAIEVEADDKRIFYSGDLRGHGRKSKLFEHMLKRPPQKIDALLMEGSSFGRKPSEYLFPDEEAVEKRIIEIIKDKENIALLFCSSQNIDRIVSVYRAVLKLSGVLVIDLYTAFILYKLKGLSSRLPQYKSDHVRVKFWNHHMKSLERAGHHDFLKEVVRSKRGIKTEEIVKRRKEIVFLAKANSLLPKLVNELDTLNGIKLIWSMWTGYITGDDQFSKFCKEHDLKWEEIHSSGHASIDDLKLLANSIKPKQLIPIHTFYPDQYKKHFQNVIELSDAEEMIL